MKQTIRRVLNAWMEHPEGQSAISKLGQLKKDPVWHVYLNFVLFLKAEIRETPLSKEFVKMTQDDQFSMLRTLRWMDEFLDWCLNPTAEIERTQAWKARTQNVVKMPTQGKA